jgi:hypothetical protein
LERRLDQRERPMFAGAAGALRHPTHGALALPPSAPRRLGPVIPVVKVENLC